MGAWMKGHREVPRMVLDLKSILFSYEYSEWEERRWLWMPMDTMIRTKNNLLRGGLLKSPCLVLNCSICSWNLMCFYCRNIYRCFFVGSRFVVGVLTLIGRTDLIE